MSTSGPLTAQRWRTRRSAAAAGIVFGIPLIAALVLVHLATPGGGPAALASDPGRQRLIRLGLNLVPFAGIAFLWFIGVVRDQLGQVEDRLFSTVFLGSGLLFLAMIFEGAVISAGLMEILAAAHVEAGVWTFGQSTTHLLVSVYAMRMSAVFTLSVSTVALRTGAVPRWIAFVGYAVAAVLLITGGTSEWVQLAFPAWVLLLSLVILLTPPAPGAQAVPG
jgi:hypothetical protein